MDAIVGTQWSKAFALDTPLLEVVVRGTIIYLVLFLLLRFVLKRTTGQLSLTDLLVITLIADAVQNGMAGNYNSVTDALVLAGTIFFWAYTIDFASYRFRRLRHLVYPPPLELVRDGRLLRENLRRDLISDQELLSHLRSHGVRDLATVAEAQVEGDGRITVFKQGER
jgi:uncharacterized membrane protein YcaP (DUF421 family)